MKKIALILPEVYPVPAVKGGAIEELVTILIEQNEIEQKANFVVFSMEDASAEEIAKQYKHTKIVYLPRTTLADRLLNRVLRYINPLVRNRTLIDIAYYRRVYAYLKEHPVDIMVAEGGLYHEMKRFAENFGKEKVFLHIHHHLLCEPYIDHIYGGVIGISEFATKEWLRTTTDTEVIPYTVHNCVNEDKFVKQISPEERDEIRKSFGFSKNDVVVIYCGRILEVKGARELVQAILEINDPHIKLLMIGSAISGGNVDTPYVREVEELVQKADGRVQFTGYIENKELYRYYQSADMQAIPSLWEEAAGLIAIEGMLCGLPLIVTKSGGLIEYAPENVAIWVEREGIVGNLKREIVKLAHDEQERNRRRVLSLEQAKKFPKRRFYNSFIEVFEHEGKRKE
ncbi:MAG: glycosyltransferase family 4 protein [Clostridiales bacterium]|nr:glycosyltransferase family 4 protein [Clostridiales bacterium]